jgi:hypothetical protein
MRILSSAVLLMPFLLYGAETGKATPTPVPTPVPTPQMSPEDEILLVKPVPYRPSLMRDPFKAPTDLESSKQGDLVDDIGVKGFVIQNGKHLACVTDSRGNIRWLPVGYKFRDGEIISIDSKAVTLRQWDVNSTNRSASRTVVKPFRREEGKR